MSDSGPVQPGGGRRRRNSCLLIGCLVVAALLVVPGTVVWALFAASADGAASEPRHQVFSHPLPPGPLTVDLGVGMAEIEVLSAPAGSPLSLEADWDAAVFRLDEGVRPASNGSTYRLHFGGRGLAFLHHRSHHGPNHLRLQIPLDRALSITGKVSLGSSELALGGLALDRLVLDLGAGSHRLSFLEPTARPMSLLRLDGSMGEITVLGAGNASPQRIDVRHGMGDLLLDLSGGWRGNGDVQLHLGMGDSRVHLPGKDEAGAVVEQARVSLGDRRVVDQAIADLPAGLPRVRIRATGGMGDLHIE